MKLKRCICTVLVVSVISSIFTQNIYATVGNSIITDVQTCRSWDLTRSRYITFVWNGVKFDSRETGAQFNLSAFRTMNEDQREKVARWMAGAGYERRKAQFSEQGAVELMEKYDTVTGWKEAGKILKQRIENKYCKDLVQYYGSDDVNDPGKFYKQECQKLTFSAESAAYKLRYKNDDYAAYDGLNEFIEKYDAIQEHMTMGKGAYDCLANEMTKATEYAVKGSSKEFISLVCDKVLVPAITPSSAISSIKKDIFAAVLELSDRATGASGKLTDMVIGKAVDGELAGSQIKQLTEMAELDYEIAKTCHDTAVRLYDEVNAEAEKIIAEYDAKRAAEDEAARKKDEEDAKAVDEKGYVYYGERKDTGEYDYLDSIWSGPLGPYATEEDEKKNAQEFEAYKSAWFSARDGLTSRINSFSSSADSAIRSMLTSYGFALTEPDVIISQTDPDLRTEGALGWVRLSNYTDETNYTSGAIFYDPLYTKEYAYNENESMHRDIDYTLDPDGCIADPDIAYFSDEGFANSKAGMEYTIELLENQIAAAKSLNQQAKTMLNNYSPQVESLCDAAYSLVRHNRFGGDHVEQPVLYKGNIRLGTLREIINMTDAEAVLKLERELANVKANYARITEKHDIRKAEYAEDAEKYKEACKEYKESCDDLKSLCDEESSFFETVTPNISNADVSQTERLASAVAYSEKYQEYERKIEDAQNYMYYCRKGEGEAFRAQRIDFNAYEYYDTYSRLGLDFDFLEYSGQYSGYENKLKIEHPVSYTAQNNYRNSQYAIKALSGTDYYNLERFVSGERAKSEAGNARRTAAVTLSVPSDWKQLAESGVNMTAFMGADGIKKNFASESAALLEEIEKIAAGEIKYIPVEKIEKANETAEIDGEVFDISMNAGQTRLLKAIVSPADATDKKIMWESLTPEIATVDEKGRVIALQNGTAIIRAWAKDCETTITDENDDEVQTYYTDTLTLPQYSILPQYEAEFRISVNDLDNPIPPDESQDEYVFGDADADNVITASDAAFVLQKTLISTFELPIQKKTNDWLKYVDVDDDTYVTASDAAFILQKTLISTFELPAEKKDK